MRLLVKPGFASGSVTHQLFGLEEQVNLLRRVLRAIGAVNDVEADLDGVIAANCARNCLRRIGRAHRDTRNADRLWPL